MYIMYMYNIHVPFNGVLFLLLTALPRAIFRPARGRSEASMAGAFRCGRGRGVPPAPRRTMRNDVHTS